VSLPSSADTVIVGAGVCGMLVARELVRAGRDVLLLERGAHKTFDSQLGDGRHEGDVPGARHTHEIDPDTPYDWNYIFGVGGSTLHWGGVTPRFMPADFELHSRYGVGVDWPFGYRELEPFYESAERALGVAAGRDAPYPRRSPPPLPAHPYAPVDDLVRPMLAPYYRLPQARPTRSLGGRPACCASGRCTLCPVNARYSALHTLADSGLADAAGFRLEPETAVARIQVSGRRAAAVECVSAGGERARVNARVVVLAAGGFENPAVLLRSGLDGPDVGRWLNDHRHHLFSFELDRPSEAGRGTTIATGISYRYADGDFRARHASTIVYPDNRGEFMLRYFEDAILADRSGKREWRRLRRRFEHTLVMDTLTEDLPNRERRVELSTRRDEFGLPLNRVHYPPRSDYVDRGLGHVASDLERRLKPLGARRTGGLAYGGSHQLGTCRMGADGGVVDPNLRHHEVPNLYVAGGSAFPTYTAAHPTLTIAALAIRLGRHLAARS
jgi:choline dehydrogenase-like flavoprotein